MSMTKKLGRLDFCLTDCAFWLCFSHDPLHPALSVFGEWEEIER